MVKSPKNTPAKPGKAAATGPGTDTAKKPGNNMAGKPRKKRRKRSLRQMLLNKVAVWSAAIGTTFLAAVTAALMTFGQEAGKRGADLLPSHAPKSPPALAFPFSLAVSSGYDAGMSYALPTPVAGGPDAEQLQDGFDGDALAAYARARGGGPQGTVTPTFTFTGLARSGTTRITDLRLYGKQGAAVLAGTQIRTRSEGEVPTVPVRSDLDKSSLEVLGADGKPYFGGHGIELAADEHIALQVTFTAAKYAYRWLMEIDYVLPDGAPRTAYADATGKLYAAAAKVPAGDRFSLTGQAPRYGAVWATNSPQPGFRLLRN